MRFALALVAPILASAVSGFTLPAVKRDGVFRAYYDENGVEVHEELTPDMLVTEIPANVTFLASSKVPSLDKRATSGTDQVYCGCGFDMNHQNCDDAVQNMKDQTGGGVAIPPRQSYYAIRGAVVDFACNYQSDYSLWVWADQIGDIAARITNSCGWYIAGSVGEAAYGVGYMRYSTGLDFCGNALSSSAHSC
ncbi:hypothetical protein GQ53DRAFT_751671 [Thozetella sp. PMI_491]|nr:hypothetical protein GQ53DRAFT_751671 [Thozetella sp. PMI_491]